jgi:A/G-specific adenine glycosylase
MVGREEQFVNDVWGYYERHGRLRLPWRKTKNPYRILVSEIMLQQTQVERVIPKYTAFLKQFPTLAVLAHAPLGDVLRAWQGLGYNRRAKMLHQCAITIVEEYGGVFPRTHGGLMKLSGVGHYTAGAVMAFAFNEPVAIIETNIRSAVIHHFFNDDTDVTDTEIMQYVAGTLDKENVREWYYALMDYGACIKREHGNPNSRSKHYTKQSAFSGSDRQIRGAILRVLSETSMTRKLFHNRLPFDVVRIDAQLEKLIEENLIQKKGKSYTLPL